MKYNVGDKVFFAEEKRPYTIRACNERFLICTKPFNLAHTVLYTIADLKEGIRGTDGYSMGPYSYQSDEDCRAFLAELIQGAAIDERNEKSEIIEDIGSGHISYYNRIPLVIVRCIKKSHE